MNSSDVSDNTLNRLFIRTYQPKSFDHRHDYDQILIPLLGYIDLAIGDGKNKQEMGLNYGEALVIKRGCHHKFSANNSFRFLVVNLDDSHSLLPPAPSQPASPFALNESILLYLAVIEKQLTSSVNANTQRLMFDLLMDLLGTLNTTRTIDYRLTKVITHLKQNLAYEHSLASMAELACVSNSHFKTLFKRHMDCTATAYLTELRMQKALGLLLNTDMPIAIVAEQCGYQSVSSFIRRFAKFYGNTPAKLHI